MIAMVESGRLGNQVFQYAALRSVAMPGETVLLLGFEQLRSTFDGLQARFIPIESNPLRHLASLDYERVSRISDVIPGVGLISEDDSARARRSPSSRWALARPSWFQSSSVLDTPALTRLKVKPAFVGRARTLLSAAGMQPTSTAFVHARAGDYRTWPSPEHPAMLDVLWYRARIDELRELRPELTVAAIGDDPGFTAEVIADVPRATAFRSDEASEFALMTICGAGVLSASSFSYWGAYFAARRDPTAIMLGPEYWVGHATREWYPPHIRADFITYR